MQILVMHLNWHMHVDEKPVKCRGTTCFRYMAVCMYTCSSPGSPCDAPGDVSGHSIGLTSGESDTKKDLVSDVDLSRINSDSKAIMVSAKHMDRVNMGFI